MIIGILLLAGLIALVVFGVRAVQRRGSGAATPDGHGVRRFFQYTLLYAMLVVAAIGLAGLLERLFDRRAVVTADEAGLALSLAFTLVGVPLYAGLAVWSRRTLAADPREARSIGWAFYATAATLTSLGLGMAALAGVLFWAVGLEDFGASALAQLIVWGGIWGVHWWVDSRVTPAQNARVHHLLGSGAGLVTSAVGLGMVLGAALQTLLDLGGEPLVEGGGNPILRGAVVLVVGAPVWLVYWILTTARSKRDHLWLGYVLLVGVGGGLVTAIVSASLALYDVLVWLIGEPREQTAAAHFHDVPSAAAAALVGVLVWWYHHSVLEEEGERRRTEVRRIYEYLMSGIALLASAAGLAIGLVAVIEATTGSTEVVAQSQSAVNTLLAAATLVVVGGPVWAFFWTRIQRAARATPQEERASATRRIYVFVLLGLGGVAAVVSLLVGVYLLFEDMIKGAFGAETIRRMRWAIGVLVSTAAVAGYHWSVYRQDREYAPVRAHGRRYVLLVGPADPDLVRGVGRRTGARVEAWRRTDDGVALWTEEQVAAALEGTTDEDVLLLSDAGGIRAIPIDRA